MDGPQEIHLKQSIHLITPQVVMGALENTDSKKLLCYLLKLDECKQAW